MDAIMTPRDKLLLAARLVEEVDAMLDRSQRTCPCCGIVARTRWDHHQIHQSLREIPERLRRQANIDVIRLELSGSLTDAGVQGA